MSRPSDNADVLRALGRFLDGQGATTFEIMNRETFLAVSWDRTAHDSEQRAYQEHQLRDLRAETRAMRRSSGSPVGSLVELLRTLGQELDRQGVELSSIVRDAEGFRVSGVSHGKLFSARYQSKALVSIAAGRRAARGRTEPGPAAPPKNERPDSFLGVMVGSPVFSEDHVLLGEVKEIRGRYFSVRGGLFKTDYWLPAESVASIGRAGEVLLQPVEDEER